MSDKQQVLTPREMSDAIESTVRVIMDKHVRPECVRMAERYAEEHLAEMVDYHLRQRMVPPQRTLRFGRWVVAIRRAS